MTTLVRRAATVAAVAALLVSAAAAPAAAAPSDPTLAGLLNNLRLWLVGMLATLATLFLTVGGVRYLMAGGDPGKVEQAKTTLHSAAIGYALAVLAPVFVSVLRDLVGG